MSERHPRRNPDPAGPASAPGAATGRYDEDDEYDEGGDPVCWIHLVCPECGAIESGGHRPGCGSAPGPGVTP